MSPFFCSFRCWSGSCGKLLSLVGRLFTSRSCCRGIFSDAYIGSDEHIVPSVCAGGCGECAYSLLPSCPVQAGIVLRLVSLLAPLFLGRMLGLEHVSELTHEIHNEFPLVTIQSIERIRDHRQLVVRPFRSALQQLIYGAV